MMMGIMPGEWDTCVGGTANCQKAQELLEAKVEQRTAELEAQKNGWKARSRSDSACSWRLSAFTGKLIDASRQAGQAEVASSVLHNVGNVLTV